MVSYNSANLKKKEKSNTEHSPSLLWYLLAKEELLYLTAAHIPQDHQASAVAN